MKYKVAQFGVLIMVVMATLLLHHVVYAQDGVSVGCQAAQQYLKTTQKPRDVRTRVDRLQSYRYIHQRLDTLVRRAERNNQPNTKNLRASVDRLYEAVETFRLDYETYDEAREAVAFVNNCDNHSDEFVKKLQHVRETRSVVAQDVALLRSIIAVNITEQLQATQQQLNVRSTTDAVQ